MDGDFEKDDKRNFVFFEDGKRQNHRKIRKSEAQERKRLWNCVFNRGEKKAERGEKCDELHPGGFFVLC